LNALLQGMEQKLTDARGLPGREWFKHFVYAPGRLTGYGVKTLPGVREAIDASRWDEANQYAVITAGVLASYCDRLDGLSALLKRGSLSASRWSVLIRSPGRRGILDGATTSQQ
jgi:N-acetylated-alpha-linked acidic dipeptidase